MFGRLGTVQFERKFVIIYDFQDSGKMDSNLSTTRPWGV